MIRLAAVIAIFFGSAFAADPYPTRSIRMVVGFAPGGGTDLTARPVAQKLSELMGQPVIVENRPGAGGNIATEQYARAAPDRPNTPSATLALPATRPGLNDN